MATEMTLKEEKIMDLLEETKNQGLFHKAALSTADKKIRELTDEKEKLRDKFDNIVKDLRIELDNAKRVAASKDGLIEETGLRIRDLEGETTRLNALTNKLQKDLADASSTVDKDGSSISQLRTRVRDLEDSERLLKNNANSLVHRYKSGNLVSHTFALKPINHSTMHRDLKNGA